MGAISAPMVTLSPSKFQHISHGYLDPEIKTPKQAAKHTEPLNRLTKGLSQ